MLKQFESSVKKDTAFKAIVNAASNNDISKLVVNRERVGKVDSYFAHRIKTDGVTNQKSSGRCWLFSALNVLRPSIIKAHKMK
ncbi:MAG TPA: aminopeptidase, partial [Caldithrix abyssi]|nr:aminopeptidase [Caldithrix abyssi]